MISAVIIDDEPHCIDRLRYLADHYCAGDLFIAGTADRVDSGFELLKELKPQLVFLDIQIHQQTGFDLLKKYTNIPFQVVFTTAFEQYAIRAFKFSAVDYLLKPIDPDEFQLTVKKLGERIDREHHLDKVELLFQNIKRTGLHDPKITVPTVSGLELIRVQDIIRCQSDVNYTTIFMKDKKSLMVAKTLKQFEGLLSSYGFFRIHNSHLVNLAYIKSYHKGKGGYVQLEDKTELEVSSRRKDDFLVRLSALK
ncbi:LytTR family DNA-binding domain-containing protein [Mucilaginibacter sp. SMC90]|uniref:LytR/AlgR family response regulator transcription factor n=1 Tax=Mucilaginibacter sp. SMC90 TaxID=2929803 RepID=UPI001FB3B4DA|nr:LytTR family DNA-binding domain-containing protein [Mucilaginibacter sp. SMC90]UOE47907.1 LytTR family DNA-binding domain-containing protein [Mucilaginibacter sp. SMC90]